MTGAEQVAMFVLMLLVLTIVMVGVYVWDEDEA